MVKGIQELIPKFEKESLHCNDAVKKNLARTNNPVEDLYNTFWVFC